MFLNGPFVYLGKVKRYERSILFKYVLCGDIWPHPVLKSLLLSINIKMLRTNIKLSADGVSVLPRSLSASWIFNSSGPLC